MPPNRLVTSHNPQLPNHDLRVQKVSHSLMLTVCLFLLRTIGQVKKNLKCHYLELQK